MLGGWCTQRKPYSNNHTNVQTLTAPYASQSIHRTFLEEQLFLWWWLKVRFSSLWPCGGCCRLRACPQPGFLLQQLCMVQLARGFEILLAEVCIHICIYICLWHYVLQMVFFISKGFHLKSLLYVARVQHIPVVNHQQSLPTLLQSR